MSSTEIVPTSADLSKRRPRPYPLLIEPVPGSHGCSAPAAPFDYAGLRWTAVDALTDGGAPIGLSLAMELSGQVTR